jgi:hypothetical protein
MFHRLPTTLKRIAAVAAISFAALSAVAFAKPAAADASTTPIFMGWGAGQAGPVQVFNVNLLCQVGGAVTSGNGTFDVQAQTFAPPTIRYNWSTELQEYYGNQWHRILLTPTRSYQGSNPTNGFDGHFTVPVNLSDTSSFRGFFWIQNPLTGQWYYAGGTSSSGQYCTV